MERNLTHIALFAALIAILGLIPGITLAAGVPVTAQSLGIMLCGTVLGAKRGGLAAMLFVVLVLAGLPLLTNFRGGISVLYGPSAGFVLGFPIAAFVAGWVVERKSIPIGPAASLGALIGGIIVLYAIGIPVMSARMTEEQLVKTFAEVPSYRDFPLMAGLAALYLPGDIIKVVLAGVVTHNLARMRPASLLSRA